MLYSVRSVRFHPNVIVECASLTDAILVQLLYRRRYDFECCIFDEDGYLVPESEQDDALQATYDALSPVHPLQGVI